MEVRFTKLLYAANGEEAVNIVKGSLLNINRTGSKSSSQRSVLETTAGGEGESDNTVIDMIFMDSIMPVMNGLQATQCIRRMGYINPIVGVTGNSLPEQITEFMDHGATHVLSKPVQFDVLQKLISGMYCRYRYMYPVLLLQYISWRCSVLIMLIFFSIC